MYSDGRLLAYDNGGIATSDLEVNALSMHGIKLESVVPTRRGQREHGDQSWTEDLSTPLPMDRLPLCRAPQA